MFNLCYCMIKYDDMLLKLYIYQEIKLTHINKIIIYDLMMQNDNCILRNDINNKIINQL